MTQTGGTVNVGADGLTLAVEAGTTGTCKLQGGTLDLGGGPITDGPGNGTFNMTGGRLQNAGSANFAFVRRTTRPGGGRRTRVPGAGACSHQLARGGS